MLKISNGPVPPTPQIIPSSFAPSLTGKTIACGATVCIVGLFTCHKLNAWWTDYRAQKKMQAWVDTFKKADQVAKDALTRSDIDHKFLEKMRTRSPTFAEQFQDFQNNPNTQETRIKNALLISYLGSTATNLEDAISEIAERIEKLGKEPSDKKIKAKKRDLELKLELVRRSEDEAVDEAWVSQYTQLESQRNESQEAYKQSLETKESIDQYLHALKKPHVTPPTLRLKIPTSCSENTSVISLVPNKHRVKNLRLIGSPHQIQSTDIPRSFPNLVYLDLREAQLDRIPSWVIELKHLEHLHLHMQEEAATIPLDTPACQSPNASVYLYRYNTEKNKIEYQEIKLSSLIEKSKSTLSRQSSDLLTRSLSIEMPA